MSITPRQLEQIQARLGGAKRKGAAPVDPPRRPAPGQSRIIVGVDPSLRGTGYGFVRMTGAEPRALAYGTIKCPAGWARSRCLATIMLTLRAAIAEHRPDACAIEGLFYAQNLQTALIMGEARGAALAVLAEAGLDIYEIAPRKVKQAIVGHGGAQKMAVAKMVQRLLGLDEPPAPDEADALALALAHAQDTRRAVVPSSKKI